MTEILEPKNSILSKLPILEGFDFNVEDIEMAAPNGGKCPYCKDGYLYWNREGSNGKQYYKCGKCGSEVLA